MLVAIAALGLAGATRYSLDAVLGSGDGAALFLAVVVVGGLVTAGAAMAVQGARRIG